MSGGAGAVGRSWFRVCVVGVVAVVGVWSGVGRAESNSPRLPDFHHPPANLPGTQKLELSRPLDEFMVDGINRFALRELVRAREQRAERWHWDYRSGQRYAASVREARELFRTLIGAVDPRVKPDGIELLATLTRSSRVAEGTSYTVHAVRWRVLPGVTAEGLLLEPTGEPVARVVCLPDADWTPEDFAGLTNRLLPQTQLARRLALLGTEVLVPTLINRDDTWSGHPEIRFTNQPHREFIYRMAFEMGRHVIGYEVQKVLAAVDEFERLNRQCGTGLPIGVVGVGEGGLLAFYSAAVDPRIDAAWVGGYFQQREGVWQEPIYRNVWALLTRFGDAELASLVAPRGLVVEACSAPEVDGPPPPRDGRANCAAPGKILTPRLESVRAEFRRARLHFDKLGVSEQLVLAVSGDGTGPAGSPQAVRAFCRLLNVPWDGVRATSDELPKRLGPLPDAAERQHRQFDELVAFTQQLMRRSAKVRQRFWSRADRSSVEAWVKSTEFYRQYVWEELIGKLPEPTLRPNPRSRLVLNADRFVAYEILLDVYPDVVAGGLLLLPKDLRPGERRPVVVCQHGLEGTPLDTVTGEGRAFRAYKAFSAELARRGFVVYAPQNPYRGRDRFRTIQRKSNPLKRSLFSYIVRQHQQTLRWLSSLPYVDSERIGFYGLSYGGKTAVRVPPLLPQYALSICSGDFNEWILKNVSSEDRYSYVFTGEYEMFEWNMGHVANYAELASLMVPRPFMVERGHRDGVAPDEWVAWEYAKVRRLYDELGIGNRTEIEFFNGPHTIHGVGTFRFLHRFLNWPERQQVDADQKH